MMKQDGPERVDDSSQSREILHRQVGERLSPAAIDQSVYETFFEITPDVLLICDPTGLLMKVNPAWRSLLGYDRHHITGKNFLEFVHPEDWAQSHENLIQALSGKRIANFYNRYRRHDGTYVQLEWEIRSDGHVVFAAARDVTLRHRIEQELARSNELYRLLAENVADVIWVMDAQTQTVLYISPSVKHLLGYSPEEIYDIDLGKFMPPASLRKLLDTTATALTEFQMATDPSREYQIEIQIRRRDGSLIWVEIVSRVCRNATGQIEIISVSRNIDAKKRSEAEIIHLSYRDHLTGLYNRRFLEEEMQRMDTERNLPISIVMGDVDRLKLVNDAFGHQKGDALIIDVANIIQTSCRPDDLIARWGGDEFFIFLPKTNEAEAAKIVARIQANCADHQINSIPVSVSFGISSKSKMDDALPDIMVAAERDMYRNKTVESERERADIVQAVVKTLFQKNDYEEKHALRVSALCRLTAQALGFDPVMVKQLALAGILHDIGKVAVSQSILEKPSALSDEERLEVQKHADVGSHIVGHGRDMAEISQAILTHHERRDGTGYPQGIQWDAVPISARIISLADSFDTMTRQNLYRTPLSFDEAVAEILRHSGTQFDPQLVNVFIEQVLKRQPAAGPAVD